MNQSAQPGARPATPGVATAEAPHQRHQRQGRAAMVSKALADAWATTSRLGLRRDSVALIRPALMTLAAPPVLCAIALLAAQGAAIHWLLAALTLMASLLALAGVGALTSARRSVTAEHDEDDEWSPLRPAAPTRADDPTPQVDADTVAQRSFAQRLGLALLALAALCALPIVLTGTIAAALAGTLAIVVLALYGVDVMRHRIAPLDEMLTPLALGPGLVSLTIVAQGQRMNLQDWLVAAALGAMAFTVIEGRRLREVSATEATNAERSHTQRSLATLLGPRTATLLIVVALLASYILALGIAAQQSGWPGALLALISLPTALIGLSGLALSHFTPARRAAARQLAWAYLWFGLALTVGLALTLLAQNIISAITLALGS
jgi:1,4-dihydroxy-2-naphthoate octaprenyltransferase